MYFSKKNAEPVQEEEVSVWSCSQDSCTGWMRENFSFAEAPECPFCHSGMVKSTKMLPVLLNNNK